MDYSPTGEIMIKDETEQLMRRKHAASVVLGSIQSDNKPGHIRRAEDDLYEVRTPTTLH